MEQFDRAPSRFPARHSSAKKSTMLRLKSFLFLTLTLLGQISPVLAQPIAIELLPSTNPSTLILRFPGLSLNNPDHALLLATASSFDGSALVPFQKSITGSSLFLPFQADHLLLLFS